MAPPAATTLPAATRPIREAYERALTEVVGAVEAFPWQDRAAYAGWLGQTYHYIVHTTRLIALAASRCGPGHDAVHRRLCEYLGDEKDHDLLVLADLAALGHSIDEFPEHPLAGAFYQVDYYWIEHVTPLALFGRCLFLEGLAAERAAWAAEQATAAFGSEAVSCLRVQARRIPATSSRASPAWRASRRRKPKRLPPPFARAPSSTSVCSTPCAPVPAAEEGGHDGAAHPPRRECG